MKKLVLLLALLPGVSSALPLPIKFGLKIGANYSQLNTASLQATRLSSDGSPVMQGGKAVVDFFQTNQSRMTGIVGGGFLRFGNKLYLQPEVLLSSKGGSFDIIKTDMAAQKVDVKVTTIDVPVLIGYKLGPLRLNAGPMASLTVSENQTYQDAFKQYTTQPVKDTFKQAVFGYQAGAGISILGLQLDVRYEGSLSDLSQVGLKTFSSDARFTTKGNLWQLTAGYAF